MNDNTYNGWTNYATWRINLEIFDCYQIESEVDGDYLEQYVLELLEIDCSNGLALNYATEFINDVNWHEIAGHLNEQLEFEE